jgi:hypothetical protein
MSFNRLIYDTCSYRQELAESVGTLDWILDANRHENANPCRFEFGLVGGNNISVPRGNLVDVESDLMGTTRLQTKCPQLKYLNPCPNGTMNTCQQEKIVIRNTPTTKGRVVDTTLEHLPNCQMFRYKPVPLPPAVHQPGCSYNGKKTN